MRTMCNNNILQTSKLKRFKFLLILFLFTSTTNASNSSTTISGNKPIILQTLINASLATTTSPQVKPVLPLPLTQQQQQDGEMDEKCQDFVQSSANNEFQSPNYPDNYFHNINCVKVISAEEGQVIRLRFLDHFNIEPGENCQYDYLEIRDGQYGYSTHIRTLCGTSPPIVIESSGRHLWLRFHSDGDIHYIGFKASYEFVESKIGRDDLNDCSFTLTDIQSHMKSWELDPEILTKRKELGLQHLDCTWLIQAPENLKISLQFRKFKLEKANDCTYNFVEVYGSRTEYFGNEGLIKQFCSSEIDDSIASKSNVIHLRFFTGLANDKSEIGLGFKTELHFYYNFYKDLTVKGPDGKPLAATQTCNDDEFDCTDNTCIDKETLFCNEEPNCKQGNDEDKELCTLGKATFKMTIDLIVIAFIGCFLALGMCTGLCLNICRKLKQDKMELDEIKASLHKSRDSMGNSSSKSSSKRQSKDDLKSIQEINERWGSNIMNSKNSSDDKNQQQQQSNKQPQPSTSSQQPVSSQVANSETNNTPASSSESKETVVYRPYFRNPHPEMLIGGGGGGSGVLHQPNAPPPHHQPYGFVVKGHLPPTQQQPQPSSSTTIPYSPPPPYNTQKFMTPHLPKIVEKKSVMVQNDEDEEESSSQNDEEVQVIEVRDSSSQTKESFTEKYLKEVYFGAPRYYPPRPYSAASRASPATPAIGSSGGSNTTGSMQSIKRAPLARGEAVEVFDPVASSAANNKKKWLRRVPKGAADVLMYPRSPGSICSSVDASTGSMELLNELDEEILMMGRGRINNNGNGSGGGAGAVIVRDDDSRSSRKGSSDE